MLQRTVCKRRSVRQHSRASGRWGLHGRAAVRQLLQSNVAGPCILHEHKGQASHCHRYPLRHAKPSYVPTEQGSHVIMTLYTPGAVLALVACSRRRRSPQDVRGRTVGNLVDRLGPVVVASGGVVAAAAVALPLGHLSACIGPQRATSAHAQGHSELLRLFPTGTALDNSHVLQELELGPGPCAGVRALQQSAHRPRCTSTTAAVQSLCCPQQCEPAGCRS